MKFKPSDFLELAKRLFHLKDSEALIRTIMGRCYYAAFLTCREKMNFPADVRHRDVYEQLKQVSRPLAGYLDFLWIHRRAADYFLESPTYVRGWEVRRKITFDWVAAERCIEMSQHLIRELEFHFPAYLST